MTKSKLATSFVLLVAILALALGPAPASSKAASHREAPLISLDPTADISDFFMFRSYETGQEGDVVLIMDVIPGEEPSSGPNYWNFDPNVLYAFYIDNDMDGEADDVAFEFRFKTEIRGANAALGFFTSYLGNVPPSDGSIIPPITALDGPGSEGLGLRQTYSVTMVKDGKRHKLADGLFAVPSNVGPRTMPNYDTLAAQGLYDLGDGMRVFAGQRDDPFYIDLGAIFDTINLRSAGSTGGVDMLSGFNIHAIALEVPASMLMDDDDDAATVLGAYAATSRRTTTVLRGPRGIHTGGRWVQVQRLANPLVNEAIIGTVDKDRWNATDPEDESQFVEYYTNPRLATALTLVVGAAATPALDLRDVLLTYTPGDYSQLSELLRLNLAVPATPLASQHRLTVLGGDAAGWPNGRRPNDDVTDVAIQVIGGSFYITNSVGDGVSVNDKTLPSAFPFLSSPWDGRNRFHTNP